MNKRCVINFAKNGWYPQGQQRLRKSLKATGDFGGDFLAFNDESQLDAPLHSENPYAFKPHTFAKAWDLGYDSVLWVDASFWAVRNITPIFEHLEWEGYLLQFDGWFVGQWINQHALNYFRLTREQAMKIEMFHAGFMGLRWSCPVAQDFHARWMAACKAGAFKGSWKDHRHDMTCGSVVAHRLGMSQERVFRYFAYVDGKVTCPSETLFFLAKGGVG